MNWRWLAVLAVILWAPTAWAATYFEFNPDYAQSLLVASAPGTVSEVFLPLNEHLAGFDFWVSNGSTAGVVTFTLYSPSDTVLAVRTVTVPAIADSENGTRFTVNLSSQLPVNGSAAHRIGIATNVPSFRLYYAEQNRILTHNGVPLPAYTGGIARIGSEDQGYSLKFALNENNESVPPQISGVTVRQPGIGTAVIDFYANEPVDAQVQYNDSSVSFSGQYSSCQPGTVPCSVTLPVTPGIPYSYTLTVRDVWSNQSLATGQFTSDGTPPTVTPTPSPTGTPTPTPSAPPDTSPPVITNARAAAITSNSVTIAWTTSEAANGIVAIFTLPFLTFAAGDSDSTLELEHTIALSGLQQGSLYRTRITTSDGSGNTTSASVDFTTINPTPTPPGPTPTPSASASPTMTPTPTVSVGPGGSGGQEVTWTPPSGGAPADGYRIDIIGADGKLIRTIRTKEISANVGDIPEGATIVVYAEHDGLYEKVAAPMTVHKTSFFARLLVVLPYILGGIVVVIGTVVATLKLRRRRNVPPPTGGSLKAQAEALGNTTT